MTRLKVSIGGKIFAIASGMLALLVGVAYVNHQHMANVNAEMIDIASYLTRLTEQVAEVNVHALEQQLHFERVLRLQQEALPNAPLVEQNMAAFQKRGQRVTQAIGATIKQAEQATRQAREFASIVEFARLQPVLHILAEDHQKFYDESFRILRLRQTNDTQSSDISVTQLEQFEDNFDRRLQSILFELGAFTEQAAQRAQLHEQQAVSTNWILSGIAMGFGMVVASIVTLGLTRPVRRLLQGTRQVETGDLDVSVPITSGDEIGMLSSSFNTMVEGVREKERLKMTFGQYVDPRIVEHLLRQPGTSPAPTKQTMTVFVSDIAGFSALSELLTPMGLVTLINQYLTLASEPISAHRGVIDKFIGDAVVAFWGPPFVKPAEHAKLACYAALEQLPQLVKLRRLLPDMLGIRKGLPEMRIRIGLATGEVVTGNIGADQFQSYTVSGQAVHMAEKLEEANKRYGTTILLTEETRKQAAEAIETREIGMLTLTEQDTPVRLYELLGYAGTLDAPTEEWRDGFEAGLRAYQQQGWDMAQSHFQTCLQLNANDKASQHYLEHLMARHATHSQRLARL